MSTLVLELPPHVLERLVVEANQRQQPVEDVASDLLSESLASSYAPTGEQERVDTVLRESGMLVYLADGLRARIDPNIQREDVIAAFENTGGRTLSEIVLDQRGS